MPTAKSGVREARVATGAALRPERFIILAIVAAVLWRAWDFLQLIPAYLRAPYQFDYEEGNIVNALLRISHHQTPYPDPHAFPSVFNTYGPVAYYTLYIPVKLFGLSFLAPRILIFSCALLIAFLLALTLWRATRSLTVAAAFGVIYLCSPIVQDWCFLVRVDFLGIALTLAGLWFFLNYPDMRGLAATVFAAALLTKLSLLAAPAACIAYLLVTRKWKQAALFALIIVGDFAVVVSIFAVLTDGAILTHLFRSHPDPFSWTVYLLRMSALFADNRALYALSAVYVIGDLLHRRATVPTLWLVFATFNAVTAGKLGSGWNHFLEWPAALCLCAGLGLFTLTQLPARSVAFSTTTIASAWLLWFALQPNLRPDAFGPVESCSSAYAWVKNDAGPNILSMNVGALVFGGKKVWVSNPFVLSQLVQQAGWSDQELTRMIREHRFDAILTDFDYAGIPAFRASGVELFSPAELQAIFNDYTITRRLHCKDIGVIYEPKSPAGRQLSRTSSSRPRS
ncbi:MAG: hypothetical protein ABSG52_03735 [Terriglobales bacterium]|jgi:hypothetical protein